ncbi:MAG: tetratricopeptide repeat-containing glycosyltransferase family protein [Terriglobales bacterium]
MRSDTNSEKFSLSAPIVEQPDRAAKQEHRTVQQRKGKLPSPFIERLLLSAVRHHRVGRLTEAARIYRQILTLDADQADSLNLLGMIAYQAGGHELAVAMIRRAIAIKTADINDDINDNIDNDTNNDLASYHSNLGTVLQAQGKLDEALACYEWALALQPELAEVHFNLGNILQTQDRLDAAVACYERALALKPELAEAHHSMGNVFQLQDKLDEAVACYERVLALTPGHAKAHYNLGCSLRALGKADEALAQYGMALSFQLDYDQANFSKTLAELLKGDFTAGWHNFEKRWQSKDHRTPMRTYRQPLWTGEKLASGRVLIWGEQGVGDEIMFAGLIPEMLRTGNHCLLDCDARLKPLFGRSFPGVDVVSGHHPENATADNLKAHNPELDITAHLPSGSLPGLFRATNAAFASTKSPYLLADPIERERFRGRYVDAHANGRRVVGLAWHTTNRKTGPQRSIELSLFAPLFGQSNIRWVSLQYGDHESLEKQAAEASAPILVDRSVDQLLNIDIFAAQIAAMDLVITIDNSTAHLAGALGVPTWVLLPFAPDWRWLLEREDSPWYPTLRLFRQPKRGDWQSVVGRIQNAL